MRDRSEQILRIACFVLGALLLMQVVRLVLHLNPLGHLRIPALPTLSVAAEVSTAGKDTNSVSATDPSKKGAKPAGRELNGSNTPARAAAVERGTNSLAEKQPRSAGTNVLSAQQAVSRETNSTLETGAASIGTHEPGIPGSNRTARAAASSMGSNLISHDERGTAGSNVVARLAPDMKGTNSGSAPPPGKKGMGPGLPPGAIGMGMNPSLPGGMGMKLPDLPPAILARVDRVTDSEILGPIMRPLPLALLGIAGDVAFLRAPSGQTGVIKEGEDLGPIKLLRIGTNRVLVEQDGQKKELTIFSGFGGDSLLPQDHPK